MLTNIKNLLISPRFISFYWKAGLTVVVNFIALLSDSLPELGLPQMAIVFVGLFLSEITKAINNYLNSKPLGFAPKPRF